MAVGTKLGVFRGFATENTGDNLGGRKRPTLNEMPRASRHARAATHGGQILRAVLAIAAAIYVALWVQPLAPPSCYWLPLLSRPGSAAGRRCWSRRDPGARLFFTTLCTLRFDFVHIPRRVFATVAGLFTSVSARRDGPGDRCSRFGTTRRHGTLGGPPNDASAPGSRGAAAIHGSDEFDQGIVWEADANASILLRQQPGPENARISVDDWLRGPNFWKDHIHPDDRDWAAECASASVPRCRAGIPEPRMIASDGHVVWVRIW
jgi:hypothetical protein